LLPFFTPDARLTLKVQTLMKFSHASFTLSAARLAGCPSDSLAEVAFAGRSNAGKSSAINALTGQSKLARISKTPGRTQLINFFSVADNHYLVDLPGYGFAKVPLKVKNQWQHELEQYLRKRQALSGLVLLSDIRHPIKEFDRTMIAWATQSELPVHVLLTKADKLKRGAANITLLKVRQELEPFPDATVQLFSIQQQQAIEELRRKVSDWLTVADEPAGLPTTD